MQLTDRFFDFTDQQLADLTAKEGIQHLGLYVSAPPNQQGPPLLLIRQWSANERSLPLPTRTRTCACRTRVGAGTPSRMPV